MWEFVSEVVPGTMNAQGGVYVWKRARARVCTYSEAGGGLVPVPRREPRVVLPGIDDFQDRLPGGAMTVLRLPVKWLRHSA